MLVIKQPDAAVMTTTDAKRDLPHAFRVAERHRVYVTRDGKPIGGLVSMRMMELLERALAEQSERRAKRADWPVRIVPLHEDEEPNTLHLPLAERIAAMAPLSRSVHEVAQAAKNART